MGFPIISLVRANEHIANFEIKGLKFLVFFFVLKVWIFDRFVIVLDLFSH